VILQSHRHGLSDNPRGAAVIDIFRLDNGKMVEHWDLIQPIAETAAKFRWSSWSCSQLNDLRA